MSAGLASVRDIGGGDNPALTALARDLDGRRAVSLDRVLSVAQLTSRFELKYLLPLEALPVLLDRLPGRLGALDIDGRRLFHYQSVYFDTGDLALYRHHVQGRRKRYKARTRSYCDTGDTMLEVKLKGARGQSLKERLPYDFHRREELTGEGREFLDAVVDDAYGFSVPTLRPSLTTIYRRATLVDLEFVSRLTIDVNLSWSDGGRRHRADHLVLIESKRLSGRDPIDALIGSMGARPVRISKYCLGVALLHPDIAANPWSLILRRQFGWQRAAEPRPSTTTPAR